MYIFLWRNSTDLNCQNCDFVPSHLGSDFMILKDKITSVSTMEKQCLNPDISWGKE